MNDDNRRRLDMMEFYTCASADDKTLMQVLQEIKTVLEEVRNILREEYGR
ncbi:MAG: hypothetical protein PHX83_12175 [Acidobacteriia bacterium]|nr:hypothetical protein [Terriglobia bacterium]